MTKQDIGEVLNRIYDSEINVRIEWVWDGGFTWVLVNSALPEPPRNMIDDTMQGNLEPVVFQEELRQDLKPPNLMKKDWLDRGSADNICDAMTELCLAVVQYFPNSNFTKWYRSTYLKGD